MHGYRIVERLAAHGYRIVERLAAHGYRIVERLAITRRGDAVRRPEVVTVPQSLLFHCLFGLTPQKTYTDSQQFVG